jgi:hypothetical protein
MAEKLEVTRDNMIEEVAVRISQIIHEYEFPLPVLQDVQKRSAGPHSFPWVPRMPETKSL